MTDHIADAEHNDLAKRAERAEREAAKLRYLYDWDTRMLCWLWIPLAFALALVIAGNVESYFSERHLRDARDACEVQAQLYLDGWRECRTAAGASTLQEDYGDGSMIDPVRRIDR